MRSITTLIFICWCVPFSFGQPGKIDTAFGNNGFTINYNAQYYSIVIQPDGKSVLAGTAHGDFAVARYNTNGTFDSSFSVKGFQTTHFNSGVAAASSIAIQEDGKIVVAGYASINGAQYDFALARYNTNGSLDNTFSGDGKAVYNIGAAYTFARGVAVQRDGKIVVAGSSYKAGDGDADFTVARVNTNGSLDNTFSGDGKQTTDFGNNNNDFIFSVAIQADGKIVAAGYSGDNINTGEHNNFALARYNENGSPDNSFGNGGKQTTDFGFGANGYSLALQADNKILVAGQVLNATYDFGLARYNTDGTPDITFSVDGKLTTGFGGKAQANSIAVQGDGKIILAGEFKKRDSRLSDFAFARYNTDGRADVGYGDGGIEITKTIAPEDQAFAISIAGNKLYAAGTARYGQFQEFTGVLARYSLDYASSVPPSVSLITPANNAGYLSGGNVYLNAIANDADGSIVKLEFYNGPSLLHTATDTPYTFKWEHVYLGNYVFTARATDNSGLVTISDPVHISVVRNKPPAVIVTGPVNGQTFLTGSTVHLEAAADDTDGRITKVEFYHGATLLRTEYKAPYSIDWTIVQPGNYVISALATDNWGAVTLSDPITITLVPNQPPIVNILSPSNGTFFTAQATIDFKALARDPDGRIVEVSFYNGTTLLTASEHKAPYTYRWKDVPAGIYVITAVAKDNWSAETISPPVTVSVIAPPAEPGSISRSSFDHIISTPENAGNLTLLPNPVSTRLMINAQGLPANKPSTISIVTASGIIVRKKQLNLLPATIQFDVSSLRSGVYFLTITTANSTVYRRFVKI